MALGLVIAAVAALCDWWAVVRGRSRVESIAKPAVMVGLGIVVLAEQPAMWPALLAAVLLSLIGDILLLSTVDRFLPGLAVFLAAHVAYVVALGDRASAPSPTTVGIVIAVALAIGGRIVAHALRRATALGGAVAAYVTVIAGMLITASTVGPVEAVGAALFVASDAVLGWNRFVTPVPHGRLATHVPYHLGQGLLVLGFVLAAEGAM